LVIGGAADVNIFILFVVGIVTELPFTFIAVKMLLKLLSLFIYNVYPVGAGGVTLSYFS